QIIFHGLASPVLANGIIPLLPKSGQPPSVGGYNDIVISSHQLKIPSIRKKLAYRTLRATLAIQKGRIFFIGVEVGWINYPSEHVLSICSFDHALFHITHLNVF